MNITASYRTRAGGIPAGTLVSNYRGLLRKICCVCLNGGDTDTDTESDEESVEPTMKRPEEQFIEGLEGVLDELRNRPTNCDLNAWRRDMAERLAWLARELEPTICTVKFEFDP